MITEFAKLYRNTQWEEEEHGRDEGGKFATEDRRGAKPPENPRDKAPAFDPAELRQHAGYDDAHAHLTANDAEYGGLMGRALERWVNEGGHIEDLEEFQQAEGRLHGHLSGQAETEAAEPEAPEAVEETEGGDSATPLHQSDSAESIEGLRQQSLDALEQAPRSPIKQAMGSLLGSKAVRKTGMIEESFFDPDYAKRMYAHLEASERDGDGFGEVYDLSGFLGEGAKGYHSPAGLLTMVPPMHKGDDWDVRFSVGGDLGSVDGANAENAEDTQDSQDVPETDFANMGQGGEKIEQENPDKYPDIVSGSEEAGELSGESGQLPAADDQSPDAGKMVDEPAPNDGATNVGPETPGKEAISEDGATTAQQPDPRESDSGPLEDGPAGIESEQPTKPKARGPGYTRAGRVRTKLPTSPQVYEAITDAIGDDNPEAFNAFRQDVEELWREEAGQHASITEATREITMRQGGKLGGFVNRLRSVDDAAQLKGFYEMVDYAQAHYPWMLHDPYGRGSNDEENNLLENLKRGMGPAPKKGDDAIIGQVLARWGNPGYIPASEEDDFSHVTEDELEAVPFRKSAEFKSRYAKWLGKSPARKWRAMVYARQQGLFREDEHPREPTGSEHGGEFAKKEDAGSSGTAKGPKLSKEEKQAAADKKFEELMATKSPEDAEAFRHARKDGIAIPPAWTEVTYYGSEEPIRAEGRDAKGRKQRAENPEYRQRISNENNARIAKDLTPRMVEIRKQLREDAAAGDEEAKVLYVIAQTGFRIGGRGDGKAKVEAFGATTLRGEHVKIDGETVTFDFPGKKGVRQKHTITDPIIADIMKGAKAGEPVFKTRDTKVRKAWQDKYGGHKVHDIRHVVATEIAATELSKRIPPLPKNAKERTKLIKEIAAHAGAKLGNNPGQALNTYIDPGLWTQLEDES